MITSRDVSKFGGVTKIGRVIESNQDVCVLQDERGKLRDLDETRPILMEFNVGKCSVLSLGRNNSFRNYFLHDTLKQLKK